jgi:hypothetical protein
MCRIGRLLMMGASNNRTKLDDTTNPTTNVDWRLYVQNWEASDDGRK